MKKASIIQTLLSNRVSGGGRPIVSIPYQTQRRFIFGRLFKKGKQATGEVSSPTTKSQLKSELGDGAKQNDDGIYNYDLFSLERREQELLSKYPEHQARIKKALEVDDSDIMNKKEHEMTLEEITLYKAALQREKAQKVYHNQKAERV